MKKAYIDTDVILDLLQQRKAFFAEASRLFAFLEKEAFRGFASPLTFANLYYVLRKDKGAKVALDALLRLKMLLKILPIGEKTIELALSSEFRDFEDAIQYYSAIESNLDCLITRNKKDFRSADIPVYHPREFLHILEA